MTTKPKDDLTVDKAMHDTPLTTGALMKVGAQAFRGVDVARFDDETVRTESVHELRTYDRASREYYPQTLTTVVFLYPDGSFAWHLQRVTQRGGGRSRTSHVYYGCAGPATGKRRLSRVAYESTVMRSSAQ